MKYSIKLSIALIAVWFIQACNDEFLERQPLDEINNEVFWNTENDLLVYNNSLYNNARNDNDVPILMAHHDGFNSHRWSMWYQDEFADNMAPIHPRHTFFQQVRAGKHIVPSNPQWFGYRNGGWDFVRNINFGLENYNRANVDQATIDKYAGEARLFRGWFYAEKVQKFGDVQWIDKTLNVDSEELFAARTPREEVMTNVLEDLNFATTALPDDWGDGNAPGRLNRWAALLVKSRV
ncbi:MAG: RagB/SusD family nutrient uptake outer membrane protein, partial [Bacteroidota bacterium]